MATSIESELTPLTTQIDIKSRLDIIHNVYSMAVSGYLKDLPYDSIPVEIIALISKFYDSDINKPIDSQVKQVIPSNCSYKNDIPTCSNTSQSRRCWRNWKITPPFEIAIPLLITVALLNNDNEGPFVVLAMAATLAVLLYIKHVFSIKNNIKLMKFVPLNNINDRAVAFKSMLGEDPEIYFKRDKPGGVGPNGAIAYPEHILKLNGCNTKYLPDISDNNTKYESLLYYFDFEVLLHFNDIHDREKYLELTVTFILNNIKQDGATFSSNYYYTKLYKDFLFDPGHPQYDHDNHFRLLIVNSKSKCLQYILQSFLALCTVLCVTWIFKLAFCCMLKREKCIVIKYLSIDKLDEVR